MTRYGERAGDALVYSSVYLAFITMIEVVIVMVLLGLPANLAPVVGGLVTFSVYANDRIADVEDDAATNPQQAAFVRRYRKPLYLLASATYGLAVALSVLGGPLALAITVLPGVVWVLYASNWIPAAILRVRRLKEVFLVNSAVVALVWSFSLTFLPIVFVSGRVSVAAGVVFAYFFLRSFVDTEIPNIRDVDGDREIGVKTLPVVIGVDRTKQALFGIDLITATVIVYVGVVGMLPVEVGIPLLVGIVYSMGLTSLVGRIENDDLLAIATELEYVIVGLALLPTVVGF